MQIRLKKTGTELQLALMPLDWAFFLNGVWAEQYSLTFFKSIKA